MMTPWCFDDCDIKKHHATESSVSMHSLRGKRGQLVVPRRQGLHYKGAQLASTLAAQSLCFLWRLISRLGCLCHIFSTLFAV
jgi:hypothetical protein